MAVAIWKGDHEREYFKYAQEAKARGERLYGIEATLHKNRGWGVSWHRTEAAARKKLAGQEKRKGCGVVGVFLI